MPVLAPDLLKVIESSILTFRLFVKMDKKSSSVRNLFGSQNQMTTPVHQVQCSLEKVRHWFDILCLTILMPVPYLCQSTFYEVVWLMFVLEEFQDIFLFILQEIKEI